MNNLFQPTPRHALVDEYVTGIRIIEPDTQLAQWRVLVDVAFSSPYWLGVWDPFDIGADKAEAEARACYADACNLLNAQREVKRMAYNAMAVEAVTGALTSSIDKAIAEA